MDRDSAKALLKSMPLFKELTDEEIQPILNIAQTRVFKPRMLVFMQGDPLDRVFFIHKGSVKIYKTDVSGKEQIISVLKPGEMFPHAGFFRKGNYPAHAEIIEETTLFVIPVANFENLLLQYPEVSIKLFRVMGDKIFDLQNRLEEQILHNSYEQIIMLMLRLAKSHGDSQDGDRAILNTHFTNRELANMIGSSRETVSRTLNQLKKKNLVDSTKEGFFILNTELLEDELF